jgi:tRNA A-37 threonylcarbamoyl transferase component Bud32
MPDRDRAAEMAQTRELSPEAPPPKPPTNRHDRAQAETQDAGASPLPMGEGDAEQVPRLAGEALDGRLGRFGYRRAAAGGARYELRGLEGMGATSRVYRVFDRDLAREIAIKVMRRPAEDADDDVDSFIDEARVTAELQHPNVLPVYELDAGDGGEIYFTMKRIEGRSLGQALEAAEMGDRVEQLADANSVVSIFIAVCQALSYAHHHGVIHQDVKPDNVMLGEFGEVLLVDWGAAARVADAKPRLYGTPLYMSPEQSRQEGVSTRSDVYCVGATLFHALLRRPPTMADDMDALMARKKRGEIDPPTREEAKRAPAALVNIALKAMSPDPDARYPSIEAMLKDLKDFQAGLAVSAYRDPLWAVLARWYRRNRKAVWVGAVAALALAIAGEAMRREAAKQRSEWVPYRTIDFTGATPDAVAADWVGLIKHQSKLVQPFEPVAFDDAEHFAIRDGALVMLGDHDLIDVAWKGVLPGDFRVEWDYRGIVANTNLNCFIGADRTTGFSFHLGGYGDPRWAMMAKLKDFVDQRRLDEPLRIDRVYRYAMEKSGHRIRLWIDGQRIFDYDDYDALSGADTTTFGFDVYPRNRLGISNVRIFTRPLAQLVSPLTVARRLYQVGKVPEATRQYDEIAAAYPDTDLATTAKVERALCLVRSGARAQGLDDLVRFEQQHPEHELVPLSVYERLKDARAERDAERAAKHDELAERAGKQVERLRGELARFRGHPVLRYALAEIAEEHRTVLAQQPVTEFMGWPCPRDYVQRMLDAQVDIAKWAGLYSLPADDSPVSKDIGWSLIRAGRHEDVERIFDPRDRICAVNLRCMGRYAEHDRMFRDDPANYVASLFDQARYAEIDAAAVSDEDRAWSLIDRGRLDEVERLYPRTAAFDQVLQSSGRVDEYAARHQADRTDAMYIFQAPAYRLLVMQHKWEDILAGYPDNPGLRAEALRGLGRYEEALALALGDVESAAGCGVGLIRQGQVERGLEVVAKVKDGMPYFQDGARMMSQYIIPAVTPAILGHGDLATAVTPLIAEHRWHYSQRLWYLASFIAGRIDEAEFRRQPYQRGFTEMLHIGRALVAERRGDRAAALAEYQAFQKQPWYEHFLWGATYQFMNWRAEALGKELGDH